MGLLDITGLGSIADLAGGIIDKIFPDKMDEAEKAQARIALEQVLQQWDVARLDAQRAIIVAEMQQGDSYTKRARPSVVYVGLGLIVLTVIVHYAAWFYLTLTGKALTGIPHPELLALPGEFWKTWGAVCGIWFIGRSAEKRGATGKLVRMITG